MKRWTVLLTNWSKLENIILLLLFSNLQSWKSYWHSLKDTSNISRCTWSHVYCFFVSRQRNVWFLFFCSWFHAAGWPWSPGGREGALFIYIGLFLAWSREKRAFRFWPRVSGFLILDVEPCDNLQSRDKITEVQSDTRWPQEAIQRCSLHSNGKWS